MQIGEKIKHLREKKGLSPSALAMRSGVPYYTITHLEKGNQKSSKRQNLVRLAKALGVSVEALVDDSISIEESSRG